MENVYDLRYKKNLIYILPERVCTEGEKLSSEIYARAAIIIYLYYMDTLPVYYAYINNIPEDIDIYVISSRCDML